VIYYFDIDRRGHYAAIPMLCHNTEASDDRLVPSGHRLHKTICEHNPLMENYNGR